MPSAAWRRSGAPSIRGPARSSPSKRLHPYLLADAVARERLEREASALAALHHPNIIEVRDLVLDPADPALVLGFVPGRTAAEAIALDGPFPEPEALAIAAAVGDALAAAHRAGIVHRDVTPSNVLLGDDRRVRLADFGIAVQDDDLGQLTRADGVIGTLRYLAPERLAGRPATPASDVWALGAVLLELVSGRPAVDIADAAPRVASTEGAPVRPGAMSEGAWAIVRRAMDPDPARRYVDGAAIAPELHELAGTRRDEPPSDDVDPWAMTRAIPLPAAAPAARGPVTARGSESIAIREARDLSRSRSRFAAAIGGLALAAVIGLVVIGGRSGGSVRRGRRGHGCATSAWRRRLRRRQWRRLRRPRPARRSTPGRRPATTEARARDTARGRARAAADGPAGPTVDPPIHFRGITSTNLPYQRSLATVVPST